MQFWSLSQEDPLKKEMATCSVFLPREFHGQRNLVGYSSWGRRRVRHNLATEKVHTHAHLVITSFGIECTKLASNWFLLPTSRASQSVLTYFWDKHISLNSNSWFMSNKEAITIKIIVVVQSLGHVQTFAIPRTAARQAPLSSTTSRSLFKLMSNELVMTSNHFILCCSLLLLPSMFTSIRVLK